MAKMCIQYQEQSDVRSRFQAHQSLAHRKEGSGQGEPVRCVPAELRLPHRGGGGPVAAALQVNINSQFRDSTE